MKKRALSNAHLFKAPSLLLTLGLSIGLLLAGVLQTWSLPLLEYDRALMAQGQWWRLLTSHWVHYGVYHLGMNLLAFLLCGVILFRHSALRGYVFLILLSSLSVSLGLYWTDPSLHRYAGLSGVLHGLLAGGLLMRIREMPWLGSLLLLTLALKLLREQSPGFDPEHPLLSVPVAVDAHWFGALGGSACALAWLMTRPFKSPEC